MAESTAAICDVYLCQWRMSSADPQGSSQIHLSDLNYLNTVTLKQENKRQKRRRICPPFMDKMGYHVKIP